MKRTTLLTAVTLALLASPAMAAHTHLDPWGVPYSYPSAPIASDVEWSQQHQRNSTNARIAFGTVASCISVVVAVVRRRRRTKEQRAQRLAQLNHEADEVTFNDITGLYAKPLKRLLYRFAPR
jgi:hypothetical protein